MHRLVPHSYESEDLVMVLLYCVSMPSATAYAVFQNFSKGLKVALKNE